TVIIVAMPQRNEAPRILIVDDNVDTARTFYVALRGEGYDAQFAVNGYSAIEAARRFLPEVVLLDIGLPDFDGCELVRVRRRAPDHRMRAHMIGWRVTRIMPRAGSSFFSSFSAPTIVGFRR